MTGCKGRYMDDKNEVKARPLDDPDLEPLWPKIGEL
jgi:hypothetical protein